MNKPSKKLIEVLDILQKKGYDDDQISDMVEKIAQAAYNQLYAEAETLFIDEDYTEIADMKTPEETQKKIFELYQKRSGSNPDEKLQEFFDTFAMGFLANLDKAESPEEPKE